MERQDPRVAALAHHLRLCIQARRLSLRAVERELEMGTGYLGQLLSGNVDLKVKHLMAVLDVLGIEPEEFFSSLYRGTLPAAVSYAPAAGASRFDAGLPGVRPREVVPGVSDDQLMRAVQQSLRRLGYWADEDHRDEEQSEEQRLESSRSKKKRR